VPWMSVGSQSCSMAGIKEFINAASLQMQAKSVSWQIVAPMAARAGACWEGVSCGVQRGGGDGELVWTYSAGGDVAEVLGEDEGGGEGEGKERSEGVMGATMRR
jgi:hypothetical protein